MIFLKDVIIRTYKAFESVNEVIIIEQITNLGLNTSNISISQMRQMKNLL